MNRQSERSLSENRPNIVAGILKRIAALAISLVLIGLILFLAAGRLNWTWAWVYLGICLVSVSINATITLRTSPETIAERGELKMTEKWDKVVSGLYALAMYFALPLVAGLNVRFGWAPDLSVTWHVAGAVVLAVGLEVSAWAMIANAYFSTAVRIQSERGHTVCSTGPYRFVRHPGYVGFILHALSLPVLLGSVWALIPGIIASACMIIRTSFEDRLLQAELGGYPDYVQKVRYRLLPGIW
ncbi:MAG: isoprenylcysteine carboxylmethyltransferase family protein [Anaerolineae bacterium]|nr:isoprenylcysteine carboxylmethyltransferase family protein [Anaerolineae bacterium]